MGIFFALQNPIKVIVFQISKYIEVIYAHYPQLVYDENANESCQENILKYQNFCELTFYNEKKPINKSFLKPEQHP